MLSQLRPAILMLALLTILTGVVYPLAMTGLAQALFPSPANGSLVVRNGQVIGSRLIGQAFDDARYFWPRPSATSPFPYNAASSSGSNYGPLNEDLRKAIAARRGALEAADPGNRLPIPADLLTASGSGLDPHISPEAALYQANRVAGARGMESAAVWRLIADHTERRLWGFLGEPRVNVVELNLALDGGTRR